MTVRRFFIYLIYFMAAVGFSAFLNTMGITALDFNEIILAFTRNDNQIIISDLLATGGIIKVAADGRLVFAGGSLAAPEIKL